MIEAIIYNTPETTIVSYSDTLVIGTIFVTSSFWNARKKTHDVFENICRITFRHYSKYHFKSLFHSVRNCIIDN